MRQAIALMVFIGMGLPALATVEIEPVQVEPRSRTVTVRLLNSGSQAARVSDVHLRLQDGSKRWITVKNWEERLLLQPGQRLILQLAPEPDSPLAAAIRRGDYRLRAEADYALGGEDYEAAGR